MQGSFISNTYNITGLLGRASFPNFTAKKIVVPRFQRGYSWEQTHVATFWEDIVAFQQLLEKQGGQSTYFLGPIVILPTEECVLLLDGQQRLATVTILLSVIRDIARQKCGQPGADFARDVQRDIITVDDENGIFSLELGELDNPFFCTYIQEDPPTKSQKARLRSHKLILQARQYFEAKVNEKIAGLSPGEILTKLKVLKNAIGNHLRLVAIQVNSEEEAFLIFETLNDRGLRLAVPDLVLNHLMRTAANEGERISIRDHWNRVIENLGQQKVSTFIRHMWVSRYGDVKRQGLFREIRDNLVKHTTGSLSFATLCAKESELYIGITNIDEEVIGQEALAAVEALVNHIEADRALPLLLSGVACLTPSDFANLARAALKVAERHSVLANLNPTILETALYAAAREVRAKHKDKETSGACLRAAKDILQKINPTSQQISSSLSEVYLTKKQADYIIYALAETIQGKTKAISLAKNSIEHVFPEKADPQGWEQAEELEPYIWHIGNLSVLEPSLNRDAENKSYIAKRTIYPKSEIVMNTFIAKKYDKWDANSILDRAIKLAPIIEKIWGETL